MKIFYQNLPYLINISVLLGILWKVAVYRGSRIAFENDVKKDIQELKEEFEKLKKAFDILRDFIGTNVIIETRNIQYKMADKVNTVEKGFIESHELLKVDRMDCENRHNTNETLLDKRITKLEDTSKKIKRRTK